jgi:plasmid maintenance system antidote protein VapI
VESLLGPTKVNFEVLRNRLVSRVKLRINNGEFTERGLARILGISQSQTHNVLKGARRLQMQLADRILTKLGLSAIDLLSEGELDAALRLKMGEWDRQMAAEDESSLSTAEFDFTGLLAPKKPAARSDTKGGNKEQHKTG